MNNWKGIFIWWLLLICSFHAGAQELHFFKGGLNEAKTEASKAGKPLMVYLSAEWCGYCLFTERNVFTSDTIYEYYNENYICLKITEGEPDYKKLKRIYHPEILPAFIFFHSNGAFIDMVDGFQSVAQLKKEGIRVKKGKKKFPGF